MESGSIIIFAYLVNMQVKSPLLLERIFEDFFADSPLRLLEEEEQKRQRQQQRQLLNLNTFQLSQSVMVNSHDAGDSESNIAIQRMDSLQVHQSAERSRRQAKWDVVRMFSVLYALDKTHTGSSSSTNALTLSGAKDALEQPQPIVGQSISSSGSFSSVSSSSSFVSPETLTTCRGSAELVYQDQGSPPGRTGRRGRELFQQDPQSQDDMGHQGKRQWVSLGTRDLEEFGAIDSRLNLTSNLGSQGSSWIPSSYQFTAASSPAGSFQEPTSPTPRESGLRRVIKAHRNRQGLRPAEKWWSKDTVVTRNEGVLHHQKQQQPEPKEYDRHGITSSSSMEEYDLDAREVFGQPSMDSDEDATTGSKDHIMGDNLFRSNSALQPTDLRVDYGVHRILDKSTLAIERDFEEGSLSGSGHEDRIGQSSVTPLMAIVPGRGDTLPQHQPKQTLTRSDKIAFLTKYTDRMHRKLQVLGIEDWGQEDIQRKKTYRMMIQHNDKNGERGLLEFYLGRYGGGAHQPDLDVPIL
ncbi:MAG: hypothetical protein J3Q66DRAFT_402148 [Benniella sp.]|nr:MAG: hypothetical protein J3Q66DRAFT_402148 [Benniella sp.]